MVFKGRGFTSGRQELGSVFSVAVCKIQASKHYAESLSLVLKDRRRFAVQLPLDCVLGFCCMPSVFENVCNVLYMYRSKGH